MEQTNKQTRHLNLIKQKILKRYSTKYIFTDGISVYSNNSIWVKNKYLSLNDKKINKILVKVKSNKLTINEMT